MGVGLVCRRCSFTLFAKHGEGDSADVRCQGCGTVAGTFKEVREAQLAAAREKALAALYPATVARTPRNTRIREG
jgi:uncharacterized Zn finger protein